ncbi:hypothetical protein QBC40DRAFT_310184 [Triangularia verruculosa]|uniref:Peptidase M20 domain-containing protein 2 n=1 Tax=Triangularia verruculosa TaxID=2587418 RepID=A0AAN6X9M3_9PEZI|nr:hypothetical protein QBC40DRAFT_310184 [Triangularia verruculosa]
MAQDGFVLVSRESQITKQSLAVSPVQSRHHEGAHDYLAEIASFIDHQSEKLWSLNKFIHNNPEIAFKEFKAHEALTKFMRSQPERWQVTSSACGIETAWIAVYDSGRKGPAVSFNVEMDALPDLGHACGHNLIASASLAGALATAQVMNTHSLAGKVYVFGTPGEEGYHGGKIQLLNRGAYHKVDVSLISHPSVLNNSPFVRTTTFCRLEVEFFGRAAHAANAPWQGINALDALVTSYNSISMLRQQTQPNDVIGFAITNGGGEATNIIHAYSSAVCTIRSSSSSRLETLIEKVSACFDAGAQAAGATVKIQVIKGYKDHVPNMHLASSFAKHWSSLPDPYPVGPELRADEREYVHVKASTDQGDISHALPSVNVSFAIPAGPEKGGPHSADFEKAAGTKGAFDRAMRVGKGMAAVAVDVLAEEGFLETVKEEWRKRFGAGEDV